MICKLPLSQIRNRMYIRLTMGINECLPQNLNSRKLMEDTLASLIA